MTGNADFETSNTFFHDMTKNSTNKLGEAQNKDNPALAELDPSVFEVSAKKQAQIWGTQQYKDNDYREDLMTTNNRKIQTYDKDIADMLVTTKHNIKVTNISEYSNAINRGRVFINPKFSSC